MCNKCKHKHGPAGEKAGGKAIKKTEKNVFNVTVGPKSKDHPFFGQGSSQGFIINGKSGAPLYLKRGKSYTFNINTPGHPFYFTTSETGGSGEPHGNLNGNPVMKGKMTLTVNNNLTSKFYYQCMLHPKMGGYVYIQNYDNDGKKGCNCKNGGPCGCKAKFGACNCGKKNPQHNQQNRAHMQQNQNRQQQLKNRMARYRMQQNQMQMGQVNRCNCKQ